MSDNNIPFEMQMEIMKRLPVKSLIQFRSLCKAWKSLIDSAGFIKAYTSQQHLLVRYDRHYLNDEPDYLSIVDDNTFPGQKVSPTIPILVNMLERSSVTGSSHGLLCLFGYFGRVEAAVLWNVSIRKAVAVKVPNVAYQKYTTILGFGVCRETCDPKIVKITYIDHSWNHMEIWKHMEIPDSIPWQVEVFTLSTRAWRNPYSSNLPRKSITFNRDQVVLDGFLYWIATDWITTDGELRCLNLIISFDITSEEFTEINLPDALAQHQLYWEFSMSKLRGSLVVFQRCGEVKDRVFNLWMMEVGVPKSCTKIFTICTPGATILTIPEFRKSGEPIIQIVDDSCEPHDYVSSLVVYEPYSENIRNIGISGWWCSLYVYSYMETLLLLDQPDLTIYDL